MSLDVGAGEFKGEDVIMVEEDPKLLLDGEDMGDEESYDGFGFVEIEAVECAFCAGSGLNNRWLGKIDISGDPDAPHCLVCYERYEW